VITSHSDTFHPACTHTHTQLFHHVCPQDDLFNADLTPASVIFLFLLPEINARLRPALAKLRPSTRILSREFEIPGWPCGERFETLGTRFLRWKLPILWDRHGSDAASEDVAEHIMECAGQADFIEAVHQDPETGSAEKRRVEL
tara:strand:- start:218 stop:649 length:432 start_codon:yes stop_codon:yes gene_type:complete